MQGSLDIQLLIAMQFLNARSHLQVSVIQDTLLILIRISNFVLVLCDQQPSTAVVLPDLLLIAICQSHLKSPFAHFLN